MNQEKIGKFIAQKRKEKNLKQEELGFILGVSSKTVSRWETGRNMPDLALLKELAKVLDVTLNDLLSGEVIEKENIKEKADENINQALLKVKEEQNIKKRLIFFLIFIFLALIIFHIISNIIYSANWKESYLEILDKNLNLIPFINAFAGLKFGFYNFLRNVLINLIITISIYGVLKYLKVPKNFLIIDYILIVIIIQIFKWLLILGMFDIDDLIIQSLFFLTFIKFSKKIKTF